MSEERERWRIVSKQSRIRKVSGRTKRGLELKEMWDEELYHMGHGFPADVTYPLRLLFVYFAGRCEQNGKKAQGGHRASCLEFGKRCTNKRGETIILLGRIMGVRIQAGMDEPRVEEQFSKQAGCHVKGGRLHSGRETLERGGVGGVGGVGGGAGGAGGENKVLLRVGSARPTNREEASCS